MNCQQLKNRGFLASSTKPGVASYLEFEKKYRNQIANRHGFIQPPHFDSARKVPIDDLYVVPRFSTVPRSKRVEAQSVNLRQLLTQIHRTVVVGNPGGGKSTLAAKVLHDLAGQYDQRFACGRMLNFVLVVLREYGRVKKETSSPLFSSSKLRRTPTIRSSRLKVRSFTCS